MAQPPIDKGILESILQTPTGIGSDVGDEMRDATSPDDLPEVYKRAVEEQRRLEKSEPATPEEQVFNLQLDQMLQGPSLRGEIQQGQALYSAVEQSYSELLEALRNPPDPLLLPVPEDERISPLLAIGATLRAVGGDASGLDNLLQQKFKAAAEQKAVAAANIEIQNRAAAQQHRGLLDALREKIGFEEFKYNELKDRLAAAAGGNLTTKEAFGLINDARINRIYASPQQLFDAPDGRELLRQAYGRHLTDQELLQRAQNLYSQPAEPPERGGMKVGPWMEMFGESLDAQFQAIAAADPNSPDLEQMVTDAMTDIAALETNTEGGRARKDQYVRRLQQALNEAIGGSQAAEGEAAAKAETDAFESYKREAGTRLLEEKLGGGSGALQNFREESTLKQATEQLDTFFLLNEYQ